MKRLSIVIACIIMLSSCDSIIKQEAKKTVQSKQDASTQVNPAESELHLECSTPAQPPVNGGQSGSGTAQSAPPPANSSQVDSSTPIVNPGDTALAEIPVEKIEIIDADGNILPVNTNNDKYILKLFVGSEYQITPRISPPDAHNQTLKYEVENYKDSATISQNGLLVITNKPNLSNKPSIRVESPNGKFAQIEVEVENDVNSIIKTFDLQGDAVVTDHGKSAITIPNGAATNATLKITKESEHSRYAYLVSDEKIVHIEKITSTDPLIDEYRITIDANQSVWERKPHILFYTEDNSGRKQKKVPLKEIKIMQEPDLNFEKDIRWVTGITSPEDGILNKKPFTYSEWTESTTTKWFHVRKISYTTNGSYPDTKMCWAMTSANMLHWWFTQNAAEIGQYMKQKNITTDTNLFYKNSYAQGAKEDVKSSFANMMRTSFKDDGSLVDIGLKWYLEGKAAVPIQDRNPSAVFHEILSQGDSLVKTSALNNRTDVNTFFINAINNQEAIAVSYQLGGGNYPRGHVITVWGISLDKVGNVIELWVADSDSQTNGTPYIYNMGIHYGTDGSPKFVNLSSQPPVASPNRFMDITTLGLGKDKFQAFFAHHPNEN